MDRRQCPVRFCPSFHKKRVTRTSKSSQVERHGKLGHFLFTASSGKAPGSTVGRLNPRRTLIVRDFKVSAPASVPTFFVPCYSVFSYLGSLDQKNSTMQDITKAKEPPTSNVGTITSLAFHCSVRYTEMERRND